MKGSFMMYDKGEESLVLSTQFMIKPEGVKVIVFQY